MEKTIRFAEIPQVRGGVAFSDPSYSADVWCCYQKAFNPSSGWVMKMESTRNEDGYAEFALMVGRKSVLSGLRLDEDAGTIHHYAHHAIDAKEIGIDTARVYCGSLHGFQEWGEEASIYTAADGLFGDLYVVTCKGENQPSGFLLMASVDTAITDENDVFRTVTAAFDGHEIKRERYEKLTDPSSLEVRKEIAKEVRLAKAVEQAEKPKSGKEKNTPER